MADEWSDAELEIAVLQYWKAVKQKGADREIDRKAIIRGALNSGLKARGEGSVSRRMCNISALMQSHGKPYVLGWKPLPNVGAGVTTRLEAMMRARELI